jgi:hypothetical protein
LRCCISNAQVYQQILFLLDYCACIPVFVKTIFLKLSQLDDFHPAIPYNPAASSDFPRPFKIHAEINGCHPLPAFQQFSMKYSA